MHSDQDFTIDPSTKAFLDEIAERLFTGHAAIMVGSGFSNNATPMGNPQVTFPSWHDLGNTFYEKLNFAEKETPKAFLDPMKLAYEIEITFGRPTLDQILLNRIPNIFYAPSSLHKKLLELPWQDIFTTNYDTLLERAADSVPLRKYTPVFSSLDLIYAEKPRIVKLHGSFPSKRPFIITEEDYRTYPADNAPFVNTVQQSLLENAFCMIGFSATDPNFLSWIGWIRDNLGTEHSPKMYFVGIREPTTAQRMVLEQRNIIYIDASKCSNSKSSYKNLEAIIDYLLAKETKNEGISWSPRTEMHAPRASSPEEKTKEVQSIIELWRRDRESYPGWCILPKEKRGDLWEYTTHWLDWKSTDLKDENEFLFLSELSWRIEKCLYPLFDDTASLVQSCISKMWSFADEKAARKRDFTEQLVDLSLALLRYYREEGKVLEWNELRDKLEQPRSEFTEVQKAKLWYEKTLWSICEFDPESARKAIAEWPENMALPFWEAKRAGIIAELGRTDEAIGIIDRALSAIRRMQSDQKKQENIELLSQEAFVMVLRRHVAFSISWQTPQEETEKWTGRWNELKATLCDPWGELDNFSRKYSSEYRERKNKETRFGFDIGSSSQTIHLLGQDSEALSGYAFLRLLEDTGIPATLPNVTIGKETINGALVRIVQYSPHWSLSVAARHGGNAIVDKLFDRRSMHRMKPSTIDGYVSQYLKAVDQVQAVKKNTDTTWRSFQTQFIPEALSRLSCKCSEETLNSIFSYIIKIYEGPRSRDFTGVANLVRRVLRIASPEQVKAWLPKMLTISANVGEDFVVNREFINPIPALNDSFYADRITNQGITIARESYDKLMHDISSGPSNSGSWVMQTVLILSVLGMLSKDQNENFGAHVWHATPTDELPQCEGFLSYAFLHIPIPADVNPTERFKRYLLQQPFPVIGEIKDSITITGGQSDFIEELVGSASKVEWTTDEVIILLRKITEWWKVDKVYVLRKGITKLGDDISSREEEAFARLRNIPRTLGKAIAPTLNANIDASLRHDIVSLVDELRLAGLPYREAKLRLVHVVPEWRESVADEIRASLHSRNPEVVVDGLLGVLSLISDHNVLNETQEVTLLQQVADMIRWRYATSLSSSINTFARFVRERSKLLTTEVELSALEGLMQIAEDTDLAMVPRGEEMIALQIRQAAANLSFDLYRFYQDQGRSAPDAIKVWQNIGRSDNEFSDVIYAWRQCT